METHEQEGPASVLVVDDDVDLGDSLVRLLRQAGFDAHAVRSAPAAIERLESASVDVVVSDVRMPGMDGMQLLGVVTARWSGLPVIVLTGHGTVPLAVQAMKAGAADFVLKPFDRDELLYTLRKALAAAHTASESTPRAPNTQGVPDGGSPAMREAQRLIERAAASEATVLLRGESGTGKELAARAVHEKSARRAGPFVAVHCGALPDALLESELFGYEKGAFTGAACRKPGRVEIAQGGTMLFDEIGDVTPGVQVKLLRLLQERTYERLGGTQTLTADVRFVAATHRDLDAMVARGEFRADLFYRLNVVPIWLPPLRDRGDDIEALARRFCETAAAANRRAAVTIDAAGMARLRELPWPGNVRELQNFVERLVVLGDGPTIGVADIERESGRGTPRVAATAAAVPTDAASLGDRRREAERAAITHALERSGGNRDTAARLLGVSRRTLYTKLKEHGVR